MLNFPIVTTLHRPTVRKALLAAATTVGLIALAVPARDTTVATAAPATIPAGLRPTSLPDVGQLELVDADQALAQRFSTAAFDVLQSGDNSRDPAAWRQASAYLDAAGRLDPTEAQYPRLRAMALEQIGDRDEAAKSLDDYLAINRDDDVARLKLIEYYASRQQTNDKKIAYLTSLVQKASTTLSDEVKSRCATWAAAALLERSRSEAVAMTLQAVKLDPLNIYARRMEYELIAANGTPTERLGSLLAQLRCNPAQVESLAAVGRELAAAGLVREAGRWYTSAFSLSNRMLQPMDSEFLLDFTAQLYLNGELKLANDLTATIVERDAGNIDGWFLKLTLQKSLGGSVDYQRDLEMAKRILVGRAAIIARAVLEEEAESAKRGIPATQPDAVASTQPTTQPGMASAGGAGGPASRPFDFTGAFSSKGSGPGVAANGTDLASTPAATSETLARVIRRLKDPAAPALLRRNFIEAITDLAWYELYYSRSEISGTTWVDIVRQLLGDADVTTRRLSGWLDLLRRRDAEAMQTLWGIRESDALAGMGVVDLLSRGSWAPAKGPSTAPAAKPTQYDPDVLAQKLLNAHPTGLVAAILVGGFKNQKLYPQPGPDADAMRNELRAFPLELIAVIDQPDRFYIPIGESTKKPYRLGEPIIVQVKLQNNSNYDLTIGPDGVIKPDLWFDGRVSLKQDRPFPMCGNDKISGPLVLKARTSILQSVRVDQGLLANALRERPAGSVNLTMTVMTNPMIAKDDTSETGYRVVAGSAGVRRQFKDMLIRGGIPIGVETGRKRLLDLAAGLPSEKFYAIDMMSAFVDQARGEDQGWQARGETNRPASLALEAEFVEQINRSQTDRISLVGAWATISSLRLQHDPGAQQAKLLLVQGLASSPAWEVRLAAVWAAKELEEQDAIGVAKSLSSDSNPLVRQAAEAEVLLAPTRTKAKPVTPGATTLPAAGPAGPSSPAGPALPKGK